MHQEREKEGKRKHEFFSGCAFSAAPESHNSVSVTGTSDYFWKMGNFVKTYPTHTLSLSLSHFFTPCLSLTHTQAFMLSKRGHTHTLLGINTRSCANMLTRAQRNTRVRLQAHTEKRKRTLKLWDMLFNWSHQVKGISVCEESCGIHIITQVHYI